MGALELYRPHYTYHDYELWEGQWELIEGIPYAMSPAPTLKHQSLSTKISWQLSNLLQGCENCQALLPIDWKISDETVVQPDNLVVCGADLQGQYLTQAPRLIFEILSPSTAHKDRHLKFELYEREAVKYYVMVDPETEVAKLYTLNREGRYIKKLDANKQTFTFEFEDCCIDFDFSQVW